MPTNAFDILDGHWLTITASWHVAFLPHAHNGGYGIHIPSEICYTLHHDYRSHSP